MPDQLPPTTSIDLANERGKIPSPCCNTHLELSSSPYGYECRDCGEEYDIRALQDADDDADESEMETPGRVEEYVDDGLCGYYDPETMDSPCSRAAGWGTDSDTGTCTQHP